MASGVLLFTVPALAHHWFPRASDQPVPIAGTVTKFVWENPHARLYVDVRDETGQVRNWMIELGSPAALSRQGWNRTSLKPGEAVAMDAFLWKGQANMAVARTVQFPDGRRLSAVSHAGDGGKTP